MSNSLFQGKFNPFRQALLILGASITFMLLEFLFRQMHLFNPDPLFAWSIATASLLFFAIFNSVLSLRADSFSKYWSQSMYSYLGMAFLNSLAAWMFSSISLNDAGSYKSIYVVISIGFLVFLSIVNFIKKIVQFAEKEEWNHPRQRRK
ncbi:MAG: hypothetical protein IPL65_04210 [Lewinellaceae bacterium]|nr:hypothetical protein [Lewinellaceae bacterium]